MRIETRRALYNTQVPLHAIALVLVPCFIPTQRYHRCSAASDRYLQRSEVLRCIPCEHRRGLAVYTPNKSEAGTHHTQQMTLGRRIAVVFTYRTTSHLTPGFNPSLCCTVSLSDVSSLHKPNGSATGGERGVDTPQPRKNMRNKPSSCIHDAVCGATLHFPRSHIRCTHARLGTVVRRDRRQETRANTSRFYSNTLSRAGGWLRSLEKHGTTSSRVRGQDTACQQEKLSCQDQPVSPECVAHRQPELQQFVRGNPACGCSPPQDITRHVYQVTLCRSVHHRSQAKDDHDMHTKKRVSLSTAHNLSHALLTGTTLTRHTVEVGLSEVTRQRMLGLAKPTAKAVKQ